MFFIISFGTILILNQDSIVNAEIVQSNEVKFHFLDVNSLPLGNSIIGSADCIIIEDNGKVTIIDAGEIYNVSINKIIDYIDNLGLKKIDNLFLTHPHSDHGGGMPAIIKNYDIGSVYLKPMDWTTMRQSEIVGRTREIYDDVYLSAKRKLNSDGTIVNIVIPDTEQQKIVVNENSYFEIFNCTEPFEKNIPQAEFNDYSMVVKYTHKNISALLMGDINRAYEHVLLGKVGECKIFKASHHGTTGSNSSDALYNEIKAEIGIISGTYGNTQIWPEWGEYIQTSFQRHNIEQYLTADDGDIIISTNGTIVYKQ